MHEVEEGHNQSLPDNQSTKFLDIQWYAHYFISYGYGLYRQSHMFGPMGMPQGEGLHLKDLRHKLLSKQT